MTIAFLFPGQGGQHVGMGCDFSLAFPLVRRRLDQGSEALAINLHALVGKGPPRALAQTDVAQVAMYCLGYATYELLIERGFAPGVVAGHSLGQFTALAAAAAMPFEVGLALVATRGKLMHQLNQIMDGGMLAVNGLKLEDVTGIARDTGDNVWVANHNAPGQSTLAGLRPTLREAQRMVAAAGGRTTWLDVAGAYHTPLLGDAAARFSVAIDHCEIHDPVIPLFANTTATLLTQADAVRTELHAHMLGMVNWAGTMEHLSRMPVSLVVEVGPGRVLKGLALRNFQSLPDRSAPQAIRCLSTDTVQEFETTCETIQEILSCASL